MASSVRLLPLLTLLGALSCVRVGARAPLAAQAACPDADAVDVVHHAVELALQLSPPSLAGTAAVRVRAVHSTAVVTLDAQNLNVTAVATADGPLPFRQVGKQLCAELSGPLVAGAELTVQLKWDVAMTHSTPHVGSDEIWAGYSTSAWMPTRQDPAQRATLALRITAPSEVKIAASGRTLSPAPASAGLTVHSFVLERPSPPFLYAFAAGRFDEAQLDVDGVRLRALGPKGADLNGALAITAPMVRFFVERTGAPFPAAEYVQAFVHSDVAQEAAGLSLLDAAALDRVREDPTEDWIFSHELAHQWFAWLLPCADFGDFWLNEGFATFFVAAFKEHRWGRVAYEKELALWRKRSAKVHADGRDAPVSLSGPDAAPRRPPAESNLQARGVTYARGALVLHKLRDELGDSVFWEGIRRYVKDRAGKGARSEDLRASFEVASGRDLRGFFATWIYAPAPSL